MVRNACVGSGFLGFASERLNMAYFAPSFTLLLGLTVSQLFYLSSWPSLNSLPSCLILAETWTSCERCQPPGHFDQEWLCWQIWIGYWVVFMIDLCGIAENSSFSLYFAISTTYSHSSVVSDWFAWFSLINKFPLYLVWARNWCHIKVSGCMINYCTTGFFYSSFLPGLCHLESILHFCSIQNRFVSSGMDFPVFDWFLESESSRLSQYDFAWLNSLQLARSIKNCFVYVFLKNWYSSLASISAFLIWKLSGLLRPGSRGPTFKHLCSGSRWPCSCSSTALFDFYLFWKLPFEISKAPTSLNQADSAVFEFG